MNIWIAGAGDMAIEYAKILNELAIDFLAIGRSETTAQKFKEQTGKVAITGGVEAYCKQTTETPQMAIVAVSTDQLFGATKAIIEKGCKKILVEKPGAVTFEQINELNSVATKNNATVYVAYNRRHYPSVREALKIIEEDGGLQSFHFEFTEWAFKIEPLPIPEIVKENWFLANSTHVIDLAFFVGGKPKQLSTYTTGELSWHKPSNFVGAGISEKGALFTYKANWDAPGRWGVEFLTKKRKLILQPLEELKVMKLGSVSVEDVELQKTVEESKFKLGFYQQVTDFFSNNPKAKTLKEHNEGISSLFLKILNNRV
jgi:predicted dehydrogenase